MSTSGEVTQLLQKWRTGDHQVEGRLFDLVYEELHRMASGCMNREQGGHILQATALAHEAYLRLVDQKQKNWQNRLHFLAVAALVMRRVLVDYARNRNTQKRGGNVAQLSLEQEFAIAENGSSDLLDLDRALDALARIDSRQARVVELRFFAGMTEEEIGQVLSLSPRMVRREWSMARAWLYGELSRARSGHGEQGVATRDGQALTHGSGRELD
jgi:RNA polymerase sigma factor (TIGR02999 family)